MINQANHGVDFVLAECFDWGKATYEPDSRHFYGEVRIVSFAPVVGRIYAMTWTQRGGNVRIISFRKANKREVIRYVQAT